MADAADVFIMFWFSDLNRIEPTETTLLDFMSPASWVSLSYGREFASQKTTLHRWPTNLSMYFHILLFLLMLKNFQ